MDIGEKIAIPTFATRVSPRFDCAHSFLVVTIDNGNASERHEFATANWTPDERINKLLDLGVDTIICGGIDRWSVARLQSAGITVYAWVTGEVEDALAALLEEDLNFEAAMQASGCRGWRCFSGEDARGQPGSGRGRRRARGARRRGKGHGGAAPTGP